MAACPKPFEVLLIEDSVPDVELLKFLFSKVDVNVNFHCAYDGISGSDMVFRRNKFADGPKFDLIVMDLNLPGKDGRELLKEIKPDQEVGRIPVVMLSTSNNHHEISELYGLGANAFISKPADLDGFQAIVNSLADFWFKRIDLPSRTREPH